MIDCSITKNYLKEKARMTGNCDINCGNCLLCSKNNNSYCSCSVLEKRHTEKAIAIVQKWSDEHPQKTYKDDFFEKFPKATNDRGIPMVCRKSVYGIECECHSGFIACYKCWNEVMSETSESDRNSL